jgi:selenocysteine-specific elongation factor
MLASDDLVEDSVRKDLPGVSPTPVIAQPDFEVNLTAPQKGAADQLLAKFAANPFSPPTVKESIAVVGDDIYNALIDMGRLMPVSGEVVFRWEDYESLVSQVRNYLEREGTITVAQMRDRFNTSRRYVLAFLEHLDAIGVTVRDGDVRKLRK